ncbi:MAG: hypothetical protein R3A45_00545 [Bdellovibrionota bacterium]
MKKTMLALMLGLSLGLYACGGSDSGGGSSAQDPSSVDFNSPTGSLSSDNAQDVADKIYDAIIGQDAVGVGFIKNDIKAIMAHKATSDSCYSDVSETGGTIDYSCISDFISGCTASGTLTYDIDGNVYSYTYNNVSISCDGYGFSSLNGTYSIDTTTTVFCTNISYTVNGVTSSSEGCYNANGDILITVDGDSYVITDTNADCSTVTAEVTDANGSNTLTCDPEPDSCTTPDDITGVTNCQIASE